jgi:hypothetical protein
MKSIKILVSLPRHLAESLKAEKQKGVTASGLIRHLLEKHLKGNKAA